MVPGPKSTGCFYTLVLCLLLSSTLLGCCPGLTSGCIYEMGTCRWPLSGSREWTSILRAGDVVSSSKTLTPLQALTIGPLHPFTNFTSWWLLPQENVSS